MQKSHMKDQLRYIVDLKFNLYVDILGLQECLNVVFTHKKTVKNNKFLEKIMRDFSWSLEQEEGGGEGVNCM